jgi:sugar lactone lactonase YvrE
MRIRRCEAMSSLHPRVANRIGCSGVAIIAIIGVGGLAIGAPGAPSAAAATAPTPTIWVVNQDNSTLLSYPLSASGNATPAVNIGASGTSLDSPFGTEAFDAAGDMWIANLDSNSLVEFTASQLASSGTPTPAVTISQNGTSLVSPGSVAFDSSGDLWALNESGNTLVEYTPSQLAASGDPMPAVTISANGTSLDTPYGFAFDASGDLWVTNRDGNTLVEYTPTQLAASGDPAPAVTVSASGPSLGNPSGVAFDASGDLWVTNSGNNTLVEYTPNQLAASGDPSPAVTISANGSSLNGPFSLAFDASGDLWVPNFNSNSLVEYTPNQLASSGDPTPGNTISGGNTGMNGPGGVAIQKAPTGYTEVASDGGIFNFNTTFYGSEGGKPLNAPIVGMALDAATGGYWEVASDGGIFSFNAPFHGSEGGQPLNAPIVGMAVDTATGGYWEVASDGGIFSFNAPFYGSQGGQPLNAPIVGIAAAPNGTGYWLVAKDGGVFGFGNGAKFYGSEGGKPLNAPVVGLAADTVTGGYWEVASDGGIFAFNAPFYGSQGGQPLNKPVVGIGSVLGVSGYWEVASDGGIFAFNVPFFGSMGGKPLNEPVVGLAAR